MRQQLLPSLTIALSAVSYPLGAMTETYISPFLLIVLRFCLTAALLWGAILLQRAVRDKALPERPLPRGGELGWCIAAGLLVQGVQFLGLYWGLAQGVSPGVAALVIAMNPIATSLLSRVVLRTRENRWGVLALVSGFLGVVLACLPRVLAHPAMGLGLAGALIGLLGLSSGSLIQGTRLAAVEPVVFTAIGVTASIPFAAVLATIEPSRFGSPAPALTLLLTLVATSALGMILYAACVRRRGPRGAAILFAVIPAGASVAAWFIQGTPIDGTTAVALLFGAGACAAQVRAGRAAHPRPVGEPGLRPLVTAEVDEGSARR